MWNRASRVSANATYSASASNSNIVRLSIRITFSRKSAASLAAILRVTATW